MNVANFVQAIASVAWLLVVGAIGFAGYQVSRGKRIGGAVSLIGGSVALALVLSVLSFGVVFVQAEERAVVISALQPTGLRPEPLQPGLRWIIPFFESVERYPISKQSYTMSATDLEGSVGGDDSIEARTSDGQIIRIDATVIYRVDRNTIIDLHIDWNDRYEDDLVRPEVRGIMRDVVSQYGVEEVNSSRREDMTFDIEAGLTEKLLDNGLILESFVLRKITFTPEYTAAIEQKQIAEQRAQEAAFVVQQRRQEAEQARVEAQGLADAAVIEAQGSAEATVLQAKADSEALSLLGAALASNPDLLEYTYVTRLGDNVQVMLVPSNSPYLFSLPEVPDGTTTSSSNPGTTLTPNIEVPAPVVEPTPQPTEEGDNN